MSRCINLDASSVIWVILSVELSLLLLLPLLEVLFSLYRMRGWAGLWQGSPQRGQRAQKRRRGGGNRVVAAAARVMEGCVVALASEKEAMKVAATAALAG